MVFDLLRGERLGGQPPGFRHEQAGEVGQADVPRQSVALDAVQRANGLGERDRGVGPVQQQHVDLRHPEFAQAFLDRPLQLAVAHALWLHLGCDEKSVAGDARRSDAAAHRLLVAVALGGIDVGVPEPERSGDDPLALLSPELPGAEAETGDGRSVPVERWYGRDGRRHARPSHTPPVRGQGTGAFAVSLGRKPVAIIAMACPSTMRKAFPSAKVAANEAGGEGPGFSARRGQGRRRPRAEGRWAQGARSGGPQ